MGADGSNINTLQNVNTNGITLIGTPLFHQDVPTEERSGMCPPLCRCYNEISCTNQDDAYLIIPTTSDSNSVLVGGEEYYDQFQNKELPIDRDPRSITELQLGHKLCQVSQSRTFWVGIDASDRNLWYRGLLPAGYVSGTSSIRCSMKLKTSLSFAQISCGDNFLLACDQNGHAWLNGTLTISENRPDWTLLNQIGDNISGIISVSTGMEHGVLLSSSGKVYTFGVNHNGALGFCETSQPAIHMTPVDIGLNNIIQISSGLLHTMCLDTTGGLWGFGYGWVDISKPHSYIFTPHQISFPHSISKISCAGGDSLIMTDNSEFFILGYFEFLRPSRWLRTTTSFYKIGDWSGFSLVLHTRYDLVFVDQESKLRSFGKTLITDPEGRLPKDVILNQRHTSNIKSARN